MFGLVDEMRLMARALRLEAELLAEEGDAATAARLTIAAEVYAGVLARLEAAD